MSLLTIIQDVYDELPLESPSAVIGNTDGDDQLRQMLRLANKEGKELMKKHEWNELITTWEFTATTDPYAETFPAEYHRLLNTSEVWRTDSVTQLSGPVNSSDWIYLETYNVAGVYPGYWRPFGGALNVQGIGTGKTIKTEYVSKYWVSNAAGDTFYEEWQADTDVARFDETLITLGILWRWHKAKGLEYAEDLDTYERELEKAIAADRLPRPISPNRPIRGISPRRSWAGQISTS